MLKEETLDGIHKNRKEQREIPIKKSDIEKQLMELKKNEPTSDNKFFRLSIIAYELGDLNRAVVYANRFNESNKTQYGCNWQDPNSILAEGKLAIADLLTQLQMLCITLGWDFEELRQLGVTHLKERQKDFQRDGWTEV